jgi:hypothetical protein
VFTCTLLLFTACTATHANPQTATPSPYAQETVSPAHIARVETTLEAMETGFPLDLPEISTIPLGTTTPATATPIPPTPTASTPLSASPAPATLTATASSTPLLQMTSDLLFISQGKLMRWDHITDYTGVLAEDVEEFSVSASGKEIALLRRPYVAANGVELFNLDLLDFDTKKIVTLIEQTPRLFQATLSPDGHQAAYMLQEGGGPVYALHIETPTQRTRLGECKQEKPDQCRQLAWSPDNRYVLWNDASGIWMAFLEKAAASLAHPNQVEVIDPKGSMTTTDVAFSSLVWSPIGRFVLVKIIPSPTGVRWYGILDTRTQKMIEVPNSHEFASPVVSLNWAQNGDLLLAHSSDPASQRPAFVNLWRPTPTHNELLVLYKSFDLSSDDFPPLSAANVQQGVAYLSWLAQRDEITFHLVTTAPDTTLSPMLFMLDMQDGSLQMIQQIPADSTQVLWSPDGDGALILGQHSLMLFASIDGGELRDLSRLLGADAHDFFWLPPTPRS